MRILAVIASIVLWGSGPVAAADNPPCGAFIKKISEYYGALALDTNARPEHQAVYRDMISTYAELYQAMDCDGVDLRNALRRIKQPDLLERSQGLKYEQQ